MSCLGWSVVVTTQTGNHSRTITGHLHHLLEYPRWLMECDTDFTNCPRHGFYDDSVTECDSCIFGKGCKWLCRYAEYSIKDAPLTSLVDALESAVNYVAGCQPVKHPRDCICENCEWLRMSRRFLRSLL